MNPKPYHAFVSHTPDDGAWVEGFVADLQSFCLNVTYSGKRELGKDSSSSDSDALKNSSAMLLVLSASAYCSERVRSDVERWKRIDPSSCRLITIDLWGRGYPDAAVSAMTPIDLTSYDASKYKRELHTLAKTLAGPKIRSSSWKQPRLPTAPCWPVDAALCCKVLDIIRFFDELESLWKAFEQLEQPFGVISMLRLARLERSGGLKSLTGLQRALLECEKYLEPVGKMFDSRALAQRWNDTNSELEEAIRAGKAKASDGKLSERQTKEEEALRMRSEDRQLRDEVVKSDLATVQKEIEEEIEKDYNTPERLESLRQEERKRLDRLHRTADDQHKSDEELSLVEKVTPANIVKTWDEAISETASYSVTAFDDVVLCMHPQAERDWQAAVPNPKHADLHCLTIETPEGAWHKEGKPDASKWKQVVDDLCGKVQAARSRNAKRIHLVAMAPVSLGALLGSLLDPQNHKLVVYQLDNVQGQKDRKSWRPYGPEWPSNPGQRLDPFFNWPPGLDMARPHDDSQIAVVINITGNGDPEACKDAVRSQVNGKTVHLVQLKALHPGQGSIKVPADVDGAANEIDRLLQQLAENFPKATLHLFYYGPLAVMIRGARSLRLRRVPIIVYEAMKYDERWHWVPAVSFPAGRLLISEHHGDPVAPDPKRGADPSGTTAPCADVLIITALKEEYDEARKVDAGAIDDWTVNTDTDGTEVSFRSYRVNQGGALRIALTWATRMRATDTVIAAGSLIEKLGVRCVAMSGVCAGRRGKVQPGDVIIGSLLYTYDTGAVRVEYDEDGTELKRFQAEPNPYPLEDQWLRAAQSFRPPTEAWHTNRPPTLAAQCDWILDRLFKKEDPRKSSELSERAPAWAAAIKRLRGLKYVTPKAPLALTYEGRQHIEEVYLQDHGGRLPDAPDWSVHVAPIATGSNVMRDPKLFDKLSDSMRTVFGVEMEAAAIAAIAHARKLRWVVMKGVMDHADDDKDDQLKPFAARASAECLIRFLCLNLPVATR